MLESEYNALQKELFERMDVNPYSLACTANYAAGYCEGLRTAKKVLTEHYRNNSKDESEDELYAELTSVKVSRSSMLRVLLDTKEALQSSTGLSPKLKTVLRNIDDVIRAEYEEDAK